MCFFVAIPVRLYLSPLREMKLLKNNPFPGLLRSCRGVSLIAALLAGLVLMSDPHMVQAFTPPARTLPTFIKRIYIREFKNNSRVFGAQADLTLHVNDEFMLDGRLDVVQSERSDVRLEGKIKFIREETEGHSGDEFPLINVMYMETIIELWDPYDSDRIVPMYRFRVPTAIQYISDPRRSISETNTEARDRLFRQAARDIVNTVLAGAPLPDTPLGQAAIRRYQERRAPAKYEPVVTQPRFPVPTPAPRKNIQRAD